MSRNYKFHNSEGLYFVSFAVVGWLDVFTRNEYKDLIVESLQFCQQKKGMEIHAWCIMTNHVHLIFRSIENQKPELLLGDFNRFTSRSIIKAIQEGLEERKREKDEETDKEGAAEKAKVDAAPATEAASATPGKRARKTTTKAEAETEKTEE